MQTVVITVNARIFAIDFPKVGRQVGGVEGAFYEAASKTVLVSFLFVLITIRVITMLLQR